MWPIARRSTQPAYVLAEALRGPIHSFKKRQTDNVSQSAEQLVLDLDGAEVAVEQVLEAIAARCGATSVQRRVDDLLRAGQVSLPAELKPLGYLLTTWTAVPVDTSIQLAYCYYYTHLAASSRKIWVSRYQKGFKWGKRWWGFEMEVAYANNLHLAPDR